MSRALPLLLLATAMAGCTSQAADPPAPADAEKRIDRLFVDKSDRVLIGYRGDREVVRMQDIQFGDQPQGHKQFEGDERTPEGRYHIDGRNPASRYHLSLRISYPNAADSAYARGLGRSPGGDIFIHGSPNGVAEALLGRDWTDGCIAVSNAEIERLWSLVPDGTPIDIQP